MKPGALYITKASWEAIHMRKNSYGIWVPKQRDLEQEILAAAPYYSIMKSTVLPDTPAMYIGTDGRPYCGVFLVTDTFCELPYNIIKPIEIEE